MLTILAYLHVSLRNLSCRLHGGGLIRVPSVNADGSWRGKVVRVGAKRGRIRLGSNEKCDDPVDLGVHISSKQDGVPKSSYSNILL